MKKNFNIALIILTLIVISIFAACTAKNTTSQSGESKEAENKVVLSNNVFSISPDSKFDNQYTTKVTDTYIELYDNESVEKGNPGLLFAICAFENPKDWAGGPHEKYGELKLNDGKLYDIIIGYPTESQFGFDSPDMPAKYKAMYDARFDIAKTVTGPNGEKIAVGAGAKGEYLYKDILNNHLDVLKNDVDSTELENKNMSPMYNVIKVSGDNYMDQVGYVYYDVNVDGIDELIIGEISDDNTAGIIYDIYTMVDRTPAHVVSGWDRNRYYVSNGSMIANEYSDGADSSGMSVYILDSNSTDFTFQIGVKYDGYTDEKNPWFVAHNKEGDDYKWESTTEDEYNEISKRFENHVKLNYIPFSSLK